MKAGHLTPIFTFAVLTIEITFQPQLSSQTIDRTYTDAIGAVAINRCLIDAKLISTRQSKLLLEKTAESNNISPIYLDRLSREVRYGVDLKKAIGLLGGCKSVSMRYEDRLKRVRQSAVGKQSDPNTEIDIVYGEELTALFEEISGKANSPLMNIEGDATQGV